MPLQVGPGLVFVGAPPEKGGEVLQIHASYAIWIAKMSGSGRAKLVMLHLDAKKICIARAARGVKFGYAERTFVMQDARRQALKKSVMLWHTSETSWIMENVHDKLLLFQTQTFLHLICHAGRRCSLATPSRAAKSSRPCSSAATVPGPAR